MPKEVTHWIIAEKIFQAMPKNSSYKAAIEQHKDVYYLGAVLHDALYYYTGDNRQIKILPDQMHGSEIQDRSIYEDANIFARALFEQGNLSNRDYENYKDLFRERQNMYYVN